MNEHTRMVKEFMDKFGVSYDGPPRDVPASVAMMRLSLLEEELSELEKALHRGELHEQLDALVDLLYVVHGTAVACGFASVIDEAFRRVHEANMAKVRATRREQSKRDSAIDIIKPEGWISPDLTDLV